MTDQPARCPATYPRSASTPPNARIVHCHLEAGHPGDHEEADTEVTWLPDEQHVTTDRPYLAPSDVLRAAADAADDAICRRLDHNQVIALVADAVWRLAYESGHAQGRGKAAAAVQRPDQAAYDRGLAEGKLEGRKAGYGRGFEQGVAEGRRQATEGWEREWSVRCLPDGFVLGQRFNEAGARARAEEIDGEPVSRLVGPWEPDGQPEAARRDRYMMATSALHKLGDISRDDPDLAIIYGDSGDDWVGQWVTGIGYVNVRFPKATTRELTDAEKATYSKLVIDEAGSVRPIVFDEPASGGVVEPSGPLTAEHTCQGSCVVPKP